MSNVGSGNFSQVHLVEVDKIIDGEKSTKTAIKILKEGTFAEGMKDFLHDTKLACQFNHTNIIKLYGICMSERFYCLVFEYMELGDLNNFLRNSVCSTQWLLMISNSQEQLNSQQLLRICHQIALGMEHFVSLNYVHCDLATRNCLVSTGLVVR